MYQTVKRYGHDLGLSCCFRQHRADSHCNLLHGYAISIEIRFEATELDHRNWVVDFGGLDELKRWIKGKFDHTLLVASDDPYLDDLIELDRKRLAAVVILPAVGCEAFAKAVYERAREWLLTNPNYKDRVRVHSVEVREHGANAAVYLGE